jgi:hypothetical protein
LSKISIKIVDIHQESNSVIVKFASEYSAKPLEEYDGLAFQLTNFSSATPEEFIKEITPYISGLVAVRDRGEQPIQLVDLTAWNGYVETVDSTVQIDPIIPEQQFIGLTTPEVTV